VRGWDIGISVPKFPAPDLATVGRFSVSRAIDEDPRSPRRSLGFGLDVAARVRTRDAAKLTPKNGSTVASPPTEIRLKFNEALEPAFTSVKLIGPAGRELASEKAHLETGDPKTLVRPCRTCARAPTRRNGPRSAMTDTASKAKLSFMVK